MSPVYFVKDVSLAHSELLGLGKNRSLTFSPAQVAGSVGLNSSLASQLPPMLHRAPTVAPVSGSVGAGLPASFWVWAKIDP